MIKFFDVFKTFLMKIYILILIFLLIFGINVLNTSKASLLAEKVYVSEGQLSVASSLNNSSSELNLFMNTLISRVSGDRFLNIILSDITSQLSEKSTLTDLKESDIARLNKFTINTLKNNINVDILDKTTTFVIEYSDSNPKIAQAINSIVIKGMYDILINKDPENILGGANGKDLSYAINREASLPTSPIPFHSSSSIMSIIKIALVSFLIYIVIVVVYDFLFAYVTNKNKASTMIKAEMISEIKMPYFKYREKKKEQ